MLSETVTVNAILFSAILAAIPIISALSYVAGRRDEHKIVMEYLDEIFSDDEDEKMKMRNPNAQTRQKKTVR